MTGDIVEIRSSLPEIRGRSIRFGPEMRNEIAATCEITGVHMDCGPLHKSTALATDIGGSAAQQLAAAEPATA